MTVWATLAGGFVGTLVLTTGMRAASELKLTRIDLPFLLGTWVTADRHRAKAVGYAMHLAMGLIFALAYHAVFTAIGHASWWLGALLGLVHGMFAGGALVSVILPAVHPRLAATATAADSGGAMLEPPGFMLMNYGTRTPLVGMAMHVVYGAIIGVFAAA